MNQDLEHLRLLSVFHYVLAGLVALSACLPLLYMAFGVAVISGWSGLGADRPPAFVGWLVVLLAAFFAALALAAAAGLALAGRSLARHDHYTLCIAIAALSCVFLPLGTVLGIFTLAILSQPSVKELFGVAAG